MAFSTANLMANSQGNIRGVSGTWTGNAGDAAGSFTIGSGNVLEYDFDPGLSSGGPTEKPLVSSAASGNNTVLTIYYHQTVTAGKFNVTFK